MSLPTIISVCVRPGHEYEPIDVVQLVELPVEHSGDPGFESPAPSLGQWHAREPVS